MKIEKYSIFQLIKLICDKRSKPKVIVEINCCKIGKIKAVF